MLFDNHADTATFQLNDRPDRINAHGLQKRAEYLIVEVPVPCRHLLNGDGGVPALVVGSVRGDCVIDIANGGHSRKKTDLVARQLMGVAAAVDPCMVVQ